MSVHDPTRCSIARSTHSTISHNKKADEASTQLACEATRVICTVALLTREDDRCALYSDSLEGLMRRSNRSARSPTSSMSTIFSVVQHPSRHRQAHQGGHAGGV